MSKRVRDVSKGGGGSPEEHPYDVSRGHNRYVRKVHTTIKETKMFARRSRS